MQIQDLLPKDWKHVLQAEFSKEYFIKLSATIENEYKDHIVYPPKPLLFHAFNSTSLQDVKLVIIGQDPYHGPGQAHGLCFSVQQGVRIPASLRNIFLELAEDLKLELPKVGNLQSWADQGVLLLNNVLSVRESQANSHKNIGWEKFTDAVIQKISDCNSSVVFLLWGNDALKKASFIDSEKHHILTSSHPSPLSVYRGFKGCKHFSKANSFLRKAGKAPIDWSLHSY